MISVIIPSYNEEKMISKTASTIGKILENNSIDYELIFVNDGSIDSTWNIIENLSQQSDKIIGINFSRNFGKESAILAGLKYAKGNCCAVIDCDLQHPPITLLDMYKKWQEGFEVIEGVKTARGHENKLHTLCANCFYAILTRITKLNMKNASDYRLLDRKVVNAILMLPEKHFFFRALSSWIGYKHVTVEYAVNEREEGVSKWSFSSLITYAVYNITSFTSIPLQLSTIMGIALGFISVIQGLHILLDIFKYHTISQYNVILLLLLIVSSIILLCLGIIGHYIALIYEEVKDRPRFVIKEICGGGNHEITN